ncbi:alpha/beta hydrolase [Eubacterium sp. 1001713B170207_170306_E7]|uniref:alpha/beta hydrolase n=1 Tax=Eubacterium sp. 1001713B170207_170306_E7 TaxID=2787097 RepID=UPI00189AFCF7|nr:alpha/beta hydrolase [Eubacterium sp. 1001713B170207_170306_E7]
MKKEQIMQMIQADDGLKLYMTTDAPEQPRAVVIITHGMCEHSGRYAFVAGKLFDCGLKVYRYDLRGHGKSEGERGFYSTPDAITEDLRRVVDIAAAENPGLRLFLLGYSMGGFAVADFCTKYPDRADGAILFDAATRDNLGGFSRVSQSLDPLTRFPNKLAKRLTSDPEVTAAYKADPLNAAYFTAGLSQQLSLGIQQLTENPAFRLPVLLLHGEKDTLVDPSDSTDFFAQIASKDKQLKIYGNTQHEIFNEAIKDQVIADVTRWIEKRL